MRLAAQGAALSVMVAAVVILLSVSPDTWTHLADVPPLILPALLLVVMIAWYANALRFYLLARATGHPISHGQSLAISMSSEFGIAASPGGMGGPALRLTLLRRAGVPLSSAATMLAADVFLDALYMVLVIPPALFVLLHDPTPWNFGEHLRFAGAGPFVGLAVTLGAVVVALALVRRLMGWAGAARPGVPRRRRRHAARLRLARRRWQRGLRRSREASALLLRERKGYLLLNFACACVQWSCRYGILPLLVLAVGGARNPLPLVPIQGLLFLAAFAFIAPGGGGMVELLSLAVLPLWVDPAVVGIVVILWRFFTYHCYLLGCGGVFVYTLRNMERIFPDADPSPPATDPGLSATPPAGPLPPRA